MLVLGELTRRPPFRRGMQHNGTVNGKAYFTCDPGYGVLTSPDNCTMIEGGGGSPKKTRSPKKKVSERAGRRGLHPSHPAPSPPAPV